jgi:hypothetical protein
MVCTSPMFGRFEPTVVVPPATREKAAERKSALSMSMSQSRAPSPTSMTSRWLPRNFFLSCLTDTLQPLRLAIGTGVGLATLGIA